MINDLINEYGKYGPSYGPGYSNHLPMAQYALYGLGCNEDAIRSFSNKYMAGRDLKIADDTGVFLSSIRGCLGQRDTYASYVTYFEDLVLKKDVKQVVKETLNTLRYGIGSALFHGMIRLSYAVTAENKEEIIRALAYLASHYTTVDVETKTIPPSILRPELARFIKDKTDYFLIDCLEEEKIQVILDGVLDLYLATCSFVVLHMVTGFEALMNLKDYFEDFDKALDIFTISLLNAMRRVSEDDYKTISYKVMKDFDELKTHLHTVNDAHTIKLLYSSERLYKTFENEKLKKVARLKFAYDHHI